MIKTFLAPSADLAQTVEADVTIEAEYGAVVIEGSQYTAAHHQAGMESHPAPCNDKGIPALSEGTVLVSHLDLDSIGGALRAMGVSTLFAEDFQGFWDLAAFIDTNGPHKLSASGASDLDQSRLYAFWAWKETTVPRFDTTRVHDVTRYIHQACDALAFIFAGDETYLEAGQVMKARTDELNAATFERIQGGEVVVRVTDDNYGFCNHLYDTPTGEPYASVAAYNKDGGTITISLSEAIQNVSCRDIMQNLFGNEAGGHEGIAGSPREQHMTYHEFTEAVETLAAAIATNTGAAPTESVIAS